MTWKYDLLSVQNLIRTLVSFIITKSMLGDIHELSYGNDKFVTVYDLVH